MSLSENNPWPGMLPYSEADAALFYGRAGEVDALFDLVQRDTLSVLYGVSGLGKTSLLRAGLFPRLRQARFLPIAIRLDHSSPDARAAWLARWHGDSEGGHARAPEAGVTVEEMISCGMRVSAAPAAQVLYESFVSAARLRAANPAEATEATEAARQQVEAPFAPSFESVGAAEAFEGRTLWEYFHTPENQWWTPDNHPVTPLLVFDQFEEIFTLGRQSPERAARAEAFLGELADLLANRPPAHVLAALESGEKIPYNPHPVQLRVMIALREDFLPHLSQLRERGFPTVRRNEMRLLPMSEAAAREVIEIPGRGLLEPGVADEILAFVAGRRGGDVEPALLSVVLRELNAKRQAQSLPRMTAALLSGSKEEILSDFYEGAFAGLDPAVRLFVEDDLVSPGGFRDSRALDDALSRPGVTCEALDTLVDRRLLRYEDRAGGGRRVELAHDLLCGVTAASRAARTAREADARRLEEEAEKRREAEAAAKATAEQAAIQHRRLRQARRVAMGFAILGFLAVAALVFAIASLRRAREESDRASASEKAANAAKDAAEREKTNAQAQQKRAEEALGKIAASEKAAHEAKDAAVAAKKDADELINYMQYDLRETLSKIGSLKMMDGINARILKYHQDHPSGEDDGAQREQAVAIDLHGDLLLAEGDLPGALKTYRDSFAIHEMLARKDPDHARWQDDLSTSYSRIGDALKAQGDLPGTLKSYRDGLAISEALAKKEPGTGEWQRSLGVGHDNVGDVLEAQGDLPGALVSYREGLAIWKALAEKDPANAAWQLDLSVSYNKIGAALKDQGDLPGALKSYRDSLAIRETQARSEPENADRQRRLSLSYDNVGAVLEAQGDLPGALKSYRDGFAISEALARKDPDNSEWQQDLSSAGDRVGEVLEAQGDLPGALKSYRDGLTISERLARKDPDNAEWQRDLSVSDINIGDVLRAQEDLPGALKSYRDSLAIRETLARKDPNNAGWQLDLSLGYERIGLTLKAQGDLPGALKSYRDSLAIRETLARKDVNNADWERDLSFSLTNVGMVFEAQKIPEDALAYYERSLAIDEKLAALDPTNATSKKDLEWDQKAVARLRAQMKSTPKGRKP